MFLVIQSTSTYLPTTLYKNIGYATIAMIMIIILNGIIRAAYLLKQNFKENEKKDTYEFKPAIGTERIV